MRLKGLDLNLLIAFEVLMEERNVSRAAEKMHLSQPAVSAVLARIRKYFGDDILQLHGKRMYPTPFALSLLPQVRECLTIAHRLTMVSSDFEPATSKRTFKIAASDYVTAVVLVPLVRHMSQHAPDVRLELCQLSDSASQRLEEGKIDLLIAPEDRIVSGLPVELLWQERYVVVGCARNPLLSKPLNAEQFYQARHVEVAMGDGIITFGDERLRQLNRERCVDVVASSFTQLPWLLIDTPRLAIMHERLVNVMAERFPISSSPLPVELPLMNEMAQYHHAAVNDEGLKWLRELLKQSVPALGTEPERPDRSSINKTDHFVSEQ